MSDHEDLERDFRETVQELTRPVVDAVADRVLTRLANLDVEVRGVATRLRSVQEELLATLTQLQEIAGEAGDRQQQQLDTVLATLDGIDQAGTARAKQLGELAAFVARLETLASDNHGELITDVAGLPPQLAAVRETVMSQGDRLEAVAGQYAADHLEREQRSASATQEALGAFETRLAELIASHRDEVEGLAVSVRSELTTTQAEQAAAAQRAERRAQSLDEAVTHLQAQLQRLWIVSLCLVLPLLVLTGVVATQVV